MSSPVVVSRIQNRRGTQDQYDGHVHNPAGPNSVYPHGYTGVGGYGSFLDFNSTNYPNVLLPGEIAFCTDSRRVFLGNIGGEYVEIAELSVGGESLTPIEWILPPSASFIPVTRIMLGPLTVTLEYSATPFFTLLYSITDSASSDWNSVGSTFSKNGELQITAVTDFTPIPNPPFPDITSVTLIDTGTEVNLVQPSDIQFKAQYIGTNIEILYRHDFATSLKFSTNSVSWISI